MTDLEPDQHPGIQNRRWVCFFLFLSVQSLPIIYWIASLPGDPKNSLIFGLSLARLCADRGCRRAGINSSGSGDHLWTERESDPIHFSGSMV